MPRYYYHLTEKRWGKNKKLFPLSNGENRCPLEPDTPRICVSSTISGCFVAKYIHNMERFYIYRTKTKVLASRPEGVIDHKITNEYWILEPTDFVLHAKIDTHIMIDIIKDFANMFGFKRMLGDGTSKTEKWQEQMKIKIKNLLKRKAYRHSLSSASGSAKPNKAPKKNKK